MLELVLLCAGCHGMSGEGRPQAGYPRIAGQPQAYLERQLEAYADGRRRSAVMEPLARSLSPAERSRLAAEFSSRTAAGESRRGPSSPRGETLALIGDNAQRVQACQNCHGPHGRGQPPYGPYLAGLAADYIRGELNAWRNGTRDTDPSGQMRIIARSLGNGDVAAVAAYYAAQTPPGPASSSRQ